MENSTELTSKLVKAFEKGSTPEKPETMEFLAGSLDTLNAAVGGNLYMRNLSATLEPDEQLFPYGTHISFLPLAHDEASGNLNCAYTFTQSDKSPEIGSTIFIKGKLQNNSHTVEGVTRHNVDMNDNQLLTGITVLTLKHLESSEGNK